MNRGQKHATAIKKVAIAQRRKVVAANLLAGATVREIAGALGVSVGTVSRDTAAILDDWKQLYSEAADQYVDLQMRRLDVLLNAVWDAARSGQSAAVDRALAILDRQNALMKVGKAGLVGRGVVLFEITEGRPDLLPLPAAADADEL